LQHGLDLGGQRQRLLYIPLRQYPRMHDQVVLFEDGQGAMPQPVDQLLAIGGVEDVVERVVAVRRADAAGHRQQVQVVVAQHGAGLVTQGHDAAQGLQRLGAAVDEVAGEDQPKRRVICTHQMVQSLPFVAATLQIATYKGGTRMQATFIHQQSNG